jgi:hypothetical protein
VVGSQVFTTEDTEIMDKIRLHAQVDTTILR